MSQNNAKHADADNSRLKNTITLYASFPRKRQVEANIVNMALAIIQVISDAFVVDNKSDGFEKYSIDK